MNTPRVLYFGISTEKFADEVGGWSNVNQMGLREAIIYDTTTKKERIYTKSDVSDLVNTLQAADLVVSFNQNQFDYKVLSSYSDANFEKLSNFDMLEKIEETLNFRVSRDNLAQNTLGGSRNERANSKIGAKVDIDKKLFAHACKEGYLLYQDKITRKKDRCDTSDWAETARNLSQSKKLIAETKESIKNNITEHSDNSIPNPPTPPITPKKDIGKVSIDLPNTRDHKHSARIHHNSIVDQVCHGNKLDIESKKIQFVEAVRKIYGQTSPGPGWNAYNTVREKYGRIMSFYECMHEIGRLSNHPPRKINYPKRIMYIDRSGTLASEWIKDATDLRIMKEEWN